jgi:predicted O-methyltransferase YrrM
MAESYYPESKWNVKSADCGQPIDCWHASDRSATELEVTGLVCGLVRGLQPLVCVETGCYRGQTSNLIGAALVANKRGRLLALDLDDAALEVARAHCLGLPVSVMRGDARRFLYPDGVDFAFIDTGDPADRMEDVLALQPYLAPHAVLVLHDTGTQFGLREPLLAWADAHCHGLTLLPTPRGIGIVTRTRH